MKARIQFLFILFLTFSTQAQEIITDTINPSEADSIAFAYEMEEIVISNVKDSLSPEERKALLLLRRRVLKVYPYAKIASERLTVLNANMARLKTNKEKKRYAKIVEKYLENEFEAQLKKLTRKEGQILVKLIYRQTGETTFDLIKEHKSGWKAFWATRIAKMFDIDIKKKYNPNTVPEDYHIEGILIKAFEERRLVKQDPAFKIDYKQITQNWREKNKK